ncbi:MAG: Tol-Pal system beta propeller repeat protein TolB [Proteobacteria bacterium]|nr:Tol-Pal system beta propeller repeat protein TolB [Pseudomonadota bacterium]
MKKTTATLMLLLLVSNAAIGQLNITIDGGSASALPIAISPFVVSGLLLDTDMASVISNDLARSGQFKPLDKALLIETPSSGDDIKYGTWRLLGADYLSYGNIIDLGNDRMEVKFKLASVADQKQLLALTLPLSIHQARAGAHYIADRIYQEILGIPGVFSTKIAYVTADRFLGDINYHLMVADADGFGPQSLVRSKEPLLSPSWSPDGKKLAYVSFEQGNSAIFIQDLVSGARTQITKFKGINGAPKFSPDGSKLAISLSKSGNPEIYIIEIMSRKLTQITNHWSIDTEPEWDTTAKSLFFTSDRGGKPQIYQVDINSKKVSRVTFEGDYNARASLSPDGKNMALMHGNNNVYKIALFHRPSGTVQILSDGKQDETPSFSPNGSMILYATKTPAGKGLLKAVSLDGQTTNELVLTDGHVREPSWSPILR